MTTSPGPVTSTTLYYEVEGVDPLTTAMPCCETGGTAAGPGTTGPVLPPTSPDWTPECTGGGTVPSAADVTEDEDWSDVIPPKRPDSWLTVRRVAYPPGSPVSPVSTDYWRWGLKPLSDNGRFVEGRLLEVGTIERLSSDKDGNYPPARMSILEQDSDRILRTALGSPTARFLLHNEAKFEVASYAGRKAGLEPRPLIQGRLVNVQPPLGRRGQLELQDIIGSQFGPLNPDKVIGVPVGDEHENLPDQSKGKIYPIAFGEYSDKGGLNVNLGDAAKGMWPPVYCGLVDVVGGSPASAGDFGSPPTIQFDGIEGAGGNATHYYGVTLITPYGESLMSTIITVENAPNNAEKSLTNYVKLSGTFDPGPGSPPLGPTEGGNRVRVWGRSTNPPTAWLDEADYIGEGQWSYFDGSAHPPTPSRDELDVEKHMTPPQISTAVQSGDVWGFFVTSIEETDLVGRPYVSDLADGGPRKRVEIPADQEDVSYMDKNSSGWPHPNPWIEKTRPSDGKTIRMSGFYLRGAYLNDYLEGRISIAVNVCGYKGLNGQLINQAFRILLSFLNEFVELNEGEGYLSGDFNNPIETFADGTPKFWTTKFEDAQAKTAEWMGGSPSLGWIGCLFVLEPTPLREILRRFFATFGGVVRFTSSHRGQMYPYVIDREDDYSTAVRLRDRMEMKQLVDQSFAWSELENRITWQYHFDPDANAFRANGPELELKNDDSINAHGGPKLGVFQTPRKDCYYCNDSATMQSVWQKHLDFFSVVGRYLTAKTSLFGLERLNGDKVQSTIKLEGLGAGDVDVPAVIVSTKHSVQLGHVETEHRIRLIDLPESG